MDTAEVADCPVDLLLADPRSLLQARTAAGQTVPAPAPDDTGSWSGPPIMLLTRAADRPSLPESVLIAADEVVTVPAPQRELLDRINRLTARRQQATDERRMMRLHVAHVVHELCTPLQAVLASAELMRTERLDPEQGELLDHITKGGERMLGLVNELLDHSRAESGHLPDRITVMDPAEAVDSAVSAVRPLVERRNLTITVDTPADAAPRVRADPVHVHRVLTNLLSNAIKYNRENGVIEVRMHVQPGNVAVDVADTGPGIAPDEIERIFQPYERLPGSTATGTGLGLPYARLLAERMGGALTVESRVGRGSTFTVVLPRVDAAPRR
ncbi:HAMP domain-containing sensor histidine kinase [Actinoplanes sp. NPDC023936]|uniref:sensor histidine kinase n=1 Tax=Actinoplanes sp. NPDC023936 TaxID=3154910 RepID=UPI0033F1E029